MLERAVVSPKPASPLKLKEFIPAVFDATVAFVTQNFGPVKESKLKELKRNLEANYLKIPEREILEVLESKYDPETLVKEAFGMIDDIGTKIVIPIRVGALSEKK